MSTEITMEPTTTTSPHWAAALGRRVAERRAERLAAQRAENEAAGGRAQVPTAELARRFADVAAVVVQALDAFATAAAIRIDSEPVAVDTLDLRAGPDRLRMLRQDDAVEVEFRGLSRGETRSWDLSVEPFAPDAVGRAIAEQFITQLVAQEGAR